MSVLEPIVLHYERLAESHLERILEIEAEAYPEPWTRGMFQDEIRNNRSYFFVAFDRDELVGYCGFWLVLDEAHITTVVVKDTQRSRGVGRQMFCHLLDTATGLGARMATLEVRITNEPAKNLYTSLGFRPVGVRRGYYPKTKEDAIVMLKEYPDA